MVSNQSRFGTMSDGPNRVVFPAYTDGFRGKKMQSEEFKSVPDCRAQVSRRRNRIAGNVGKLFLATCLAQVVLPAVSQQPEFSPETAQALRQGAAAMKAGNFPLALQSYQLVTKSRPGFAEGYLNLGLAQQQLGEEAAAIVSLEKAQQLKPELPGPALFLGILEYRRNQYAQAEAWFRKESRLDPRNAKPWMWLGLCHLAQEDPAAAIAPLDKAYALDPKDVDILYHRGRAYLLVANASYREMFRLGADSPRVHQVLAESSAMASQPKDAIQEFELAIRMAPAQPGLHEELGNQYWIENDLDKAAAAYREEIRLDPHSTTARYKLGALLVLSQKPAEGAKLLQDVVAETPNFSAAHYYQGVGLESQELGDQAGHEFEQVIALEPESDWAMSAWYKLAQIHRNAHEADKTQSAMQNFLRLRARSKDRQAGQLAAMDQHRGGLPVPDQERVAMKDEHRAP